MQSTNSWHDSTQQQGPAELPTPRTVLLKRLSLSFVYLLAIVQFTWFYLSRVPSEIHLLAYEHGLERTPFQYRMLLMYPLAWAHSSHTCISLANYLTSLPGWFPNRVHPEGIAEAAIDFLSLVLAAVSTSKLYRLSSRTAFLAPFAIPLMLVMCAASYAFQVNHALRFVYDLPSMAFFSIALVLIYTGSRPWLFSALFLVATVNRETTLLLLLFYVLADRTRGHSAIKTARVVIPLSGFWIAFHLWVVHRFAANPHVERPRLLLNLATVAIPLSWPQLLGIFGYLLPVLVMRRRLISDPILRSWIHVLWAWLAFMLFFGLLMETRIFGELIPYATCSLLLIAEQWLANALPLGDARTLLEASQKADRMGCEHCDEHTHANRPSQV